jgi:hypothetical protein
MELVQASSFSQMATRERRIAVAERAQGVAFMRRGKSEGWREELSARSVQAIEERFGDLMEVFGYELLHGGK